MQDQHSDPIQSAILDSVVDYCTSANTKTKTLPLIRSGREEKNTYAKRNKEV